MTDLPDRVFQAYDITTAGLEPATRSCQSVQFHRGEARRRLESLNELATRHVQHLEEMKAGYCDPNGRGW
jgi:hypothetical protein